jgi:hypothetical protein
MLIMSFLPWSHDFLLQWPLAELVAGCSPNGRNAVFQQLKRSYYNRYIRVIFLGV